MKTKFVGGRHKETLNNENNVHWWKAQGNPAQ